MRHIMLVFLSNLNKYDPKTYIGYSLENEEIEVEGIQTNEAPVKYVIKSLGKEKQLDKIYLIVTPEVLACNALVKMSTLDFFKNRINEFCEEKGYNRPDYKEISFDTKTVYKNKKMALFNPIFEMLDKIEEDGYLEEGEKPTNIYLDITGGFRDTTMLLLSTMRLLQYRGICMKQVIYSNFINYKIEDVTSIYEIYDLISGAQEFTQFGSIRALAEYYKEERKSKELEELLEQMNLFSESLQLCKADDFEKCLSKLGECIRTFKESQQANKEDKLFNVLLQRIEKEYSPIIKKETSMPEIIKWCAERGFIQQALTLYAECIPKHLVAEKIIYPINQEEVKRECKLKGNDYQDWESYFVNVFVWDAKYMKNLSKQERRDRLAKENKDFADKMARKIGDKIRSGKDETLKDTVTLESIIKVLERFNQEEIKYSNLQDIEMKNLIDLLYKEYRRNCLSKGEAKSKQVYINNKLSNGRIYKEFTNNIELIKTLWEFDSRNKFNRNALRALNNKEVNFKKGREIDIVKVLSNYYETKHKRNNTNHASNNSQNVIKQKGIVEGIEEEKKALIDQMNLILSVAYL